SLKNRLLTKQSVRQFGGSSLMNKFRLNGDGPRFIKIGASVRYRLSDIDIWIESRERANTSDIGPQALE
ncbi:MAG: hypothetical protein OEZ32_11215, partial [Nitrospinota bacterium]|nr:hypothetical protein [Nitrospinota bacterium]